MLLAGLLLMLAAPDAGAVADAVLKALGGEEAWQATRFLHFDFAVEVDGKEVMRRSHHWDRWDGRYRVSGKTREGQSYLVLMNVGTRQGSAWLDGEPVEGETRQKLLDRGHSAWINDTYWLLMPFKLRDPGVTLELEDGGPRHHKLALSFDAVGLTPKDRYWVYVNRETNLVDRWEYILQGEKPEGPPTGFDWSGWARYGRIRLAPERTNAADKERIHFPVLEAPDTIPDALFARP